MKAFVALVLAAIWSVGLIVASATAPFYSSSSASSSSSISSSGIPSPTPVITETSSESTLLEVNGPGALVVVSIPLAVVAAVSLMLWRRHARSRRGAGPVAWTTVGVLGAFTLLAMMSIGLFILPITILLIVACALTPAGAPDSPLSPIAPNPPLPV